MFTLEQVVPWGRSFEEYRRMFALGEEELRLPIVGCGDGPASFNAEATRRGVRVVSCDPLYRWSADEIRRRIDATYDQVMEQTRQNQAEFTWNTIRSVEELGRIRMEAMLAFLGDYEAAGDPERAQRCRPRYVAAELPRLPFADAAFGLALCSHFLFLYSEQLTEAFHLKAIREMRRVASEVRVFPLLALGSRPSPHVDPVSESLRSAGYAVSIEKVPYEFQRGGNRMLRVR